MSLPSLVAALVAFPAVIGAILILITRTPLRNALVVIGGIAIGVLAVATVISFGNTSGVFFGLPGGLALGNALIAIEIALTAFVVVISLMNRRFLAPLLAITQLGISLYLEIAGKMPEQPTGAQTDDAPSDKAPGGD